ncbi:MAG: transposase [Terracidiphilus sp.]
MRLSYPAVNLPPHWQARQLIYPFLFQQTLSCHQFRSNEVQLWLSVIAYNLGSLWWRRLVLPKGIGTWSLTTLQQQLAKTGGRLVKHARCYRLMLAKTI